MFDQNLRAVEISGSGIVVSSSSLLDPLRRPLVVHLSLQLPERRRPIFAVARSVRTYGYQEALRFIEIADVDRLTLAEHMDVAYRRGGLLN